MLKIWWDSSIRATMKENVLQGICSREYSTPTAEPHRLVRVFAWHSMASHGSLFSLSGQWGLWTASHTFTCLNSVVTSWFISRASMKSSTCCFVHRILLLKMRIGGINHYIIQFSTPKWGAIDTVAFSFRMSLSQDMVNCTKWHIALVKTRSVMCIHIATTYCLQFAL